MTAQPQPLEKGLRRNVLGSMAGWGIPVAVNLIAIPILLRHLGTAYYGILSIVTIASTYLGFLAGPTTSGSVRYMAAAYASEDWPRFREAVHTGIVAAAVVSLLGAALMFASAWWLATRVFSVPSDMARLTASAIRYGAALLLFTSLSNAASAIPSAVRRVDVSSLMISGATCAVNIGGAAAALAGCDLLRILEIQSVASAASVVAGVVVCFLFLPRKALLPLRAFSLAQFRSQFVFAGQLSAGSLLSLLHLQIDRFVVAVKLGPAAVAAYGVPARAGDQIGALLGRLTTPLYPLAAEAHATGIVEKYRRLYAEAVVNMLWVSGLIASLLAGSGRPLLQLWGVGRALPPESATVLGILAYAQAARAPSIVAYQCGNGFGKGTLYIAMSGLGVMLAGVPIVLLTPMLGVTGTALGFCAGIAVLSIVYDLYTRRAVLGERDMGAAIAAYIASAVMIAGASFAPAIPVARFANPLLAALRGGALSLAAYGILTAIMGAIEPKAAPIAFIRNILMEAWRRARILLRGGGDEGLMVVNAGRNPER